jgi:protein Mpv17
MRATIPKFDHHLRLLASISTDPYLVSMMSSMMVNSTIQAAALAGLSNFLAQVIQAYRTDRPLLLDYKTLSQFVVFSLIATPPNVLWQEYVEAKFPADHIDKKGDKKLHKGNTMIKFVLDQTLGAMVNSYLFIASIGALKGRDASTIWADCQRVSLQCSGD